MARLLGVDIPNNKKIVYALCYIYGIGLTLAKVVVDSSGIDPNLRAKDLNEEQLNKLSTLIIQKGFKVEGDRRRDIAMDIARLKAIKSYRGLRHLKGLPCRGQRTKTNAQTRKSMRGRSSSKIKH